MLLPYFFIWRQKMKYELLHALLESRRPISWMLREDDYYDEEPARPRYGLRDTARETRPSYGYQPPTLSAPRPPSKPWSRAKKALVGTAAAGAGLLGAGALAGAYQGLKARGKTTSKSLTDKIEMVQKLGADNFGKKKSKYSQARDVVVGALEKARDRHIGYPKAMYRGAKFGLRHPIAALSAAGRNVYKKTIGRWDD
jgi:hypothetical protein